MKLTIKSDIKLHDTALRIARALKAEYFGDVYYFQNSRDGFYSFIVMSTYLRKAISGREKHIHRMLQESVCDPQFGDNFKFTHIVNYSGVSNCENLTRIEQPCSLTITFENKDNTSQTTSAKFAEHFHKLFYEHRPMHVITSNSSNKFELTIADTYLYSESFIVRLYRSIRAHLEQLEPAPVKLISMHSSQFPPNAKFSNLTGNILSERILFNPTRFDDRSYATIAREHVANTIQNTHAHCAIIDNRAYAVDYLQSLLDKYDRLASEQDTPISINAEISSASPFLSRVDALRLAKIKQEYGLLSLSQPNLEKALRMAAANNKPVDAAFLIIRVKVNVDAVDSNAVSKKTALHHAAQRNHNKVVSHLLRLKADTSIQDANGKTARMLAPEGCEAHQLLLKREGVRSEIPPLIDLSESPAHKKESDALELKENLCGLPDEMWSLILSHLYKIDLLRVAVVSREFKRLSTCATLWTVSASIVSKEAFISYFSRIPFGFRRYLMSLSMPQLQQAAVVLDMNLSERKAYFALQQPLGQVREANLFSNENCILLLSGEISLQDAIAVPSLLTPIGITALREKLITVDAAKLFRHTGSTKQCRDLSILLCPNGLKMLRKKLIFPESASVISGLDTLLSDDGVYMLENGLITPSQAANFYHSGSPWHCTDLAALVNKQGIKALEKRLLTVEEASSVPELAILLSDLGLHALEKKLITVRGAAKFYHDGRGGHCTNLHEVICKNGIAALEEGLLTIEQMYQMPNLKVLTADNSPYFEYLREGLVSFDELNNIDDNLAAFEKYLRETVAKRAKARPSCSHH